LEENGCRRSVRTIDLAKSWENKKMPDEIIREVWRAKDELAKQFNYDIEALAAELQKRQKESGRKVVNLEKESADQTAAAPQ
jgi:predicted TIM-barrel fold metal-dependent hydrolase